MPRRNYQGCAPAWMETAFDRFAHSGFNWESLSMVRILIVDDHAILRRGLRTLLAQRADWEVCGEAIDGRDAIQQARQLLPDVILLDISLPQMTGLEAAKQILKDVPKARIVIVSQHEPVQMESRALEIGAHAYVAKLYLSRDLLPAIDAVLRQRDAHG